MLFRTIPRNWRHFAERLGCATIHADHRRLRPAIVAEIRASGYSLLAYTVNDLKRANTLFGWGVASVFSDAPHRLQEAATPGIAGEPTSYPAGMTRRGSVR
jgi:glycerophosphoryl diester phosphodiesterase